MGRRPAPKLGLKGKRRRGKGSWAAGRKKTGRRNNEREGEGGFGEFLFFSNLFQTFEIQTPFQTLNFFKTFQDLNSFPKFSNHFKNF
jgi:hypothetical protein